MLYVALKLFVNITIYIQNLMNRKNAKTKQILAYIIRNYNDILIEQYLMFKYICFCLLYKKNVYNYTIIIYNNIVW